MKIRDKRIFVVFSISILMLIMCEPILAEDIYNTTVKYSDVSIAWGNGIDDNGDGVIDDWNEADVINGTKNVSLNDSVIGDTWYENFIFPGTLDAGVQVSAFTDEIWEIYSNNNVSVSPTQSCYYLNLDYEVSNFSGYDTVSDVLNILRFYVNMSPKDTMNGAQEIWYRSPLVWDDTDNDYETHYLNIYDDSDNLVYASPNDTYSSPKPKYVVDNSSLDGVGGERVYYKLNMNFRSNTRYRFEEYVEIVDDNPVNSVKLYMARGQDIGDDDETNTYAFVGSPYGRKIPAESSWGMIFAVGLGRAGTEKLLFSNTSYGLSFYPSIYTQRFSGDPDIDDTDNATFIFPIRTTMPLNISISFRVWSGGDMQSWVSPADPNVAVLRNVTDTVVFTIPILDPNATASNEYQLCFSLLNFNQSDHGMTYLMYPSIGDTNMVTYGTLSENVTINHFAVHIEIANENAALPGGDKSDKNPGVLNSIYTLTLGRLLVNFQILTGFDIALQIAGVPASMLEMVGNRMVIASGILEGGLIGMLFDGAGRAINGFIDGVKWIAGLIQKVVVGIVEIVKLIGSALMHWGGIIFEAIVQIIYLIAFLAVIWIWAKFLKIMTGIVRGDIDAALATTTQVIRTFTKPAKVYKRYAKKMKKRIKKAKRRR